MSLNGFCRSTPLLLALSANGAKEKLCNLLYTICHCIYTDIIIAKDARYIILSTFVYALAGK